MISLHSPLHSVLFCSFATDTHWSSHLQITISIRPHFIVPTNSVPTIHSVWYSTIHSTVHSYHLLIVTVLFDTFPTIPTISRWWWYIRYNSDHYHCSPTTILPTIPTLMPTLHFCSFILKFLRSFTVFYLIRWYIPVTFDHCILIPTLMGWLRYIRYIHSRWFHSVIRWLFPILRYHYHSTGVVRCWPLFVRPPFYRPVLMSLRYILGIRCCSPHVTHSWNTDTIPYVVHCSTTDRVPTFIVAFRHSTTILPITILMYHRPICSFSTHSFLFDYDSFHHNSTTVLVTVTTFTVLYHCSIPTTIWWYTHVVHSHWCSIPPMDTDHSRYIRSPTVLTVDVRYDTYILRYILIRILMMMFGDLTCYSFDISVMPFYLHSFDYLRSMSGIHSPFVFRPYTILHFIPYHFISDDFVRYRSRSYLPFYLHSPIYHHHSFWLFCSCCLFILLFLLMFHLFWFVHSPVFCSSTAFVLRAFPATFLFLRLRPFHIRWFCHHFYHSPVHSPFLIRWWSVLPLFYLFLHLITVTFPPFDYIRSTQFCLFAMHSICLFHIRCSFVLRYIRCSVHLPFVPFGVLPTIRCHLLPGISFLFIHIHSGRCSILRCNSPTFGDTIPVCWFCLHSFIPVHSDDDTIIR